MLMLEQKRENSIFAELFQDPTMRQQREGHKTQEVYEQNNKFACASHFFVHLFAVFALRRLENA